MLHQSVLPTKWTHWLLSKPVCHTSPAKHMSAGRGRRVLHRFKAECALALLLTIDPLHDRLVVEIVAMGLREWRMGHLR